MFHFQVNGGQDEIGNKSIPLIIVLRKFTIET